MTVNVTASGGAGTHSFTRTNVNTAENFIYYRNTAGSTIPTVFVPGTTFLYTDGAGAIEGLTGGQLLYVRTTNAKKLTFSTEAANDLVDLTGARAGGVNFNTPIVFDNKLNIDGSTVDNQAVKYFTNGDPIIGLVSGQTYFLKNVSISEFAGSQALYPFTSHTFTSAGQTGRVGPTQNQMRTAYSAATWSTTFLTQGSHQGYQDWIVPVSGIYEFTATGAPGFSGFSATRPILRTQLTNNVATITTNGTHNLEAGVSITISSASNSIYNGTYTVTGTPTTSTFTYARSNANIGLTNSSGTVTVEAIPGRGAVVRGRVSLTKGETVTVAVGQVGVVSTNNNTIGGSGGATFVVRKSGNEPLFVAGGGSADPGTRNGRDAVLSTLGGVPTDSRQIAGTVPGLGGNAAGGASGGGGGFSTRGGATFLSGGALASSGGGSFADGLTIPVNTRFGGYGGFGGGGQSDSQVFVQSSGGGGFSGGAGARTTQTGHTGGGGGSFLTPTATAVGTSNGTYNGTTTFNGVAIQDLAAWGTNTTAGSVAASLVSSFTTGNEIYPTASDSNAGTNVIAIEPNGTGFHALVPIDLDIQNNQVHSSTPHTLTNGEAIVLNFGGTPPAGLLNDIIYYVNTVNPYAYRISTTPLPNFSLVDFTRPSSKEQTSAKLSRVVVNTVTNTLTIPNHGFLVDQPLLYNTNGGSSIAPLVDGVTYYVAEVVNANQIKLKLALNSPNPISLTSAGTGTAHSFIFKTVNELDDTLYIPNHGLVSGQAVRYSNGGGTSIVGLVHDTTYFVSRVDASLIRLSLTRALNSVVNITNVGAGTHSLIITSLDFTTNTITVPNHGFLQGELLEYDSKGNDPVAGLTTATPYYVIFVDGDNIKLAVTPEDAIEGTSVDITEPGEGTHSFRSLSKTPDGIYTIDAVPSAKTFTVVAPGTVPLLQKDFNPRASVNLQQNAFNIESHGFITGTKLTYANGVSGTDIEGLEDGEDYFVIGINKDYFRLALTVEDAAAGIPFILQGYGTGVLHNFRTDQINGNITGGGSVSVGAGSVLVDGTGTQFSKILKVGDKFRLFPQNTIKRITFAEGDVNTTTNVITKAHTFLTGDAVVFLSGGGVAPAPLVSGYYYFARVISSTEITLHVTQSDATNNLNSVDFTNQGTGAAFTLTNVTPLGPIIRTITAIGSDTQVTVDRPYALAYSEVAYTYPTFIYVRPEGYSLHRPFDGGVEMSVGAGTSLGQIVRQTRKYFRYQSGKGIQTSAGLNFKPSVDLESMTRFSNNQIICKTRRPHGLISGLFIVIAQATDSNDEISDIYNGVFQVSVQDLTTFRISSSAEVPTGEESRAFGFPQFHVREWSNGAIRSGMFDFQNGMFFEFDGEQLYAVRRSSTQQIAGTVSALQGSELVFGSGTKFTAQLDVGDFIVMRGQTYRVADIESDTRLTVRPEYKGSSGTEKEFNPGNGTTGVVRTATDTVAIVGHGFSDGIPVVYNSIDGEPIGGLINGRTYYVDLINNNSFKLLAAPDAEANVNLSSAGTTSVHSFTPAKSGIIVTKTVDTRVPQTDWSIDPCDGTGPTGFNLDVSRIQMVYIDYSWYGAGKIRFGFKTTDGQVQYVHEFVHNNQLFESYFRSGNLPARYEVVTFNNPTYIPSLFHWGTSVMMDGGFDDDRAYLFTATSQALGVQGTTTKSFASSGINLTNDLFTVQTHGFSTGNVVQFDSVAPNGLPGDNVQNPATAVVGSNVFTTLQNTQKYKVFVNSPNLIHLTPTTSKLTLASEQAVTTAQEATLVTVVTEQPHELTTGMYVGIYGSPRVSNGPFTVTRVNDTQFTYAVPVGPRVRVNISTAQLNNNVASLVTTSAHGYVTGDVVVIAGATNSAYNGTYTVLSAPTSTSFTYSRTNANIALGSSAGTASISVPTGTDTGAAISEVINFTSQGNTQYTYFLYPEGALANTSGPNYQPLISLRLSPSVSSGLTGKLGDRDVINRMQLRLREVGISTNELVDVKLMLNARLNNLNFQGVDSPSLVQIVEHTSADTVSGGVQVYNFKASGGANSAEQSTVVDVEELFELSNSILGGDSTFPDGPDIITVAVSRLTGANTITGAKLSWTEAQA